MALTPHAHIPIYNTLEKVDNYWNRFISKNDFINTSYLEKWKALYPFFKNVSHHNGSIVSLWHPLSHRFIYFFDERKILDIPIENYLKEDGIDFSLARFHPEYLNAGLTMQQRALEYIIPLAETDVRKVIFSLDSLYKKGNNEYIHILQQSMIAETDENGFPVLFLNYIYDITHLKKERSANLVVTSSNERLIWNYNFEKAELERSKSLSMQETKILNLLSQGKQSREIAEQFSISPNTIDTHRRNLLKKTNCLDTTALVSYCRLVGWI